MPTTGPRPADIAFDEAAALAALAAIDRSRAVLRDTAGARVEASATARTHFRGLYAGDFRTADHEIGQTSNDTGRGLAALRSAIETAIETARVARAVRSVEQHAWDTAQPPPLRPGAS